MVTTVIGTGEKLLIPKKIGLWYNHIYIDTSGWYTLLDTGVTENLIRIKYLEVNMYGKSNKLKVTLYNKDGSTVNLTGWAGTIYNIVSDINANTILNMTITKSNADFIVINDENKTGHFTILKLDKEYWCYGLKIEIWVDGQSQNVAVVKYEEYEV